MTIPFTACGSCGCLVKTSDPTCPFCGSEVAHRKQALRPWRTSRGVWIAVGSSVATAAAVGCMTNHSGEEGSAGSGLASDAATTPPPPSSTASATTSDAAPPPSACATQWCGSHTCDTATEFCTKISHRECCDEDDYFCSPRTSLPACVGGLVDGGSCAQDACGGVVVAQTITSCDGCPMPSGSSCYGCPPARV